MADIDVLDTIPPEQLHRFIQIGAGVDPMHILNALVNHRAGQRLTATSSMALKPANGQLK
ncbi:MAG TPA: hypothetical protein VFD70_15645 [Anaerolineae bacterium]|nr:hypothetical protein [Anaerolineae bacterium]